MYSETDNLFQYQWIYCKFVVRYNECKWYNFFLKKAIKEQIDHYYPLMKSEVEFLK